MSLFTAAAVVARPAFARRPPGAPPAPVTLDAGRVEVFGRLRIAVPPQYGAPRRVLSQGAYGNAYIRRPGKKAADVGRIDYYARAVNTAGARDRFVVETDATLLTVQVEVTDAIPGGTVRYLDAESGSDDNDGRSPGSAWRTWKKAVESAPANSTVVVKGRTMSDRNMVYDVPTVGRADDAPTLANSGVHFKADPADAALGNFPMVWSEGDALSPYWFEPGGKWELHDGASGTWRTVAGDLPALRRATGMYRAADDRWVRLFFYGNTADRAHALDQLTETGGAGATHPNTTKYQGPGFAVAGGHIYVRLDGPPPSSGFGPQAPWFIAPSWGWDEYKPPDTDPNNVPIKFGCTDVIDGVTRRENVSLLRMSNKTDGAATNIHFVGGGWQWRVYHDCGGWTLKGCRFWAGATPDMRDQTDAADQFQAHNFFLDYGSSPNWLVDRCEFYGGVPPWATWWGIKGAAGGHEAGCRHTWWSGGTTSSSRHLNWTVRNCVLSGMYDTMIGNAGDGVSGWKFHHNITHDVHMNGGIRTRRTDAPFYYIRNLFLNSNDYSWNLFVSVSDWPDSGNIFEVYNLQILTQPFMKRTRWSTTSGPSVWQVRHRSLQHGSTSESRGVPRSFYYCTRITTNHTNMKAGRGMGVNIMPDPEISDIRAIRGYNSILACLAGPRRWDHHGDDPCRDSLIGYYCAKSYRPWPDGPQNIDPQFDGNHLWKDPAAPGASDGGMTAVVCVRAGTRTSDDIACDSIQDVRDASRRNGGVVFEAHGTMGDPQWVGPVAYPEPYSLDPADKWGLGRWALREGSPCGTGAVDISNQDWGSPVFSGRPVDMDGFDMVPLLHQPHRGCYDPDVPLIEQELGPL